MGHPGVRGAGGPHLSVPSPSAAAEAHSRLCSVGGVGAGGEAASLLGGDEAPRGGTSLWETSSQFLLLQLSSGCRRHQRGRVLMWVIKDRAGCQEAENASGLQRGRKPEK